MVYLDVTVSVDAQTSILVIMKFILSNILKNLSSLTKPFGFEMNIFFF